MILETEVEELIHCDRTKHESFLTLDRTVYMDSCFGELNRSDMDLKTSLSGRIESNYIDEGTVRCRINSGGFVKYEDECKEPETTDYVRGRNRRKMDELLREYRGSRLKCRGERMDRGVSHSTPGRLNITFGERSCEFESDKETRVKEE